MQQDRTTGQSARESGVDRGQARGERGRAQRDQAQQNRASQTQQDRTTGQGAPDERREGRQTPQNRAQPSQSGSQQQQSTRSQTPSQTGATTQGQTGAATQGQTGAAVQSLTGRTTLSAQQQTTIQQSVLSASNVPRLNNVNFAVNVGTVIPSNVNIISVSTFPVLIDAFPRFRDFSFFVVEDEIVFLDRSRRIVDVVPVGPRARFSRRSGATTLNLSQAEIRQVQQVLIDRRLLVGQVDGVFGRRTREALISFQRQQGIQTTGSIDTRTVAALGLSNRVGQQGSQAAQDAQRNAPTTTGQGQSGQSGGQQPSAQQSRQTAPRNQSTTGQGGNQPSGSMSGQGNPQPPAQNQPNQNPPNR